MKLVGKTPKESHFSWGLLGLGVFGIAATTFAYLA